MADKTGIEWTDATWNPIVGCSIVSPGCTNCYAMWQAARIIRCSRGAGRPTHYDGTIRQAKDKPVWTGIVRQAPDSILLQPLRWKAPRRIFVNSMGDLFHDDVPDVWIDRVFAVVALSPQHTFQILTKRSARMRAYFEDEQARFRIDAQQKAIQRERGVTIYAHWDTAGLIDDPDLEMRPNWPIPNVWLGVSAEDQRRADERIPDLLATPAAVRFVSAEPLLGPVDFTCLHADSILTLDALTGMHADCDGGVEGVIDNPDPKLDWIIVGGESGPGARPMHPDWARSIRDQCAAAGTAFFFKQWGEWAPSETAPCKESALAVICQDGQMLRGAEMATGRMDDARAEMIAQFGKAKAGRLLDDLAHNAMPEVRHG